MFDKLAEVLLSNSLEAERHHAQVKQWEGSKLTHIATASRNKIARRYLRWRDEMCDLIRCHATDFRKAVRTNLQALAWAGPAGDELRPAGVQWSTTRQPATAADDRSTSAASSSAAPRAIDTVALQTVKDDMMVAARSKLDVLLRSFCVPVTREQWSAWLAQNITEFRASMASVRALRRQGSRRLRPRLGLPPAVGRLQPRAESHKCKRDWARNLQYRTGWHGIQTRRNGLIVVFLMHLSRRTHYIKVPCRNVAGEVRCLLGDDFSLLGSVHDLDHLEHLLADDDVLKLVEFCVGGVPAGSDGVDIVMTGIDPIHRPAPSPPAAKAGGDVTSDDDEPPLKVVGSDVEESGCEKVVDTDDESDGDSALCSDTGDESESDTDLKAKVAKSFLRIAPAPVPTKTPPPAGASLNPRRIVPPLWHDDYFWVRDGTADDLLQIRVRGEHYGGMVDGTSPMSKQIKPSEYGEMRCKPVRSLLLLRAWSVWRARQSGWADARECRRRYIDEHEAMLARDVMALHAPCGVLGHEAANAQLMECLPAMVGRLRRLRADIRNHAA